MCVRFFNKALAYFVEIVGGVHDHYAVVFVQLAEPVVVGNGYHLLAIECRAIIYLPEVIPYLPVGIGIVEEPLVHPLEEEAVADVYHFGFGHTAVCGV